jgi:hypothetical protein
MFLLTSNFVEGFNQVTNKYYKKIFKFKLVQAGYTKLLNKKRYFIFKLFLLI